MTLVIRKMQIKTTIDAITHPPEWLKLKGLTTACTGVDAEPPSARPLEVEYKLHNRFWTAVFHKTLTNLAISITAQEQHIRLTIKQPEQN